MILIENIPYDYNSWLECFKLLDSGSLDKTSYLVLCQGTCTAYYQIKPYFHCQLTEAVNKIIKKYIADFKRDLKRHSDFNEIANISISFMRLSQKLRFCLFFRELSFLDENFSAELYESVISEVEAFWNGLLDTLKKQVFEQNNRELEDEYFRIRRIQIFDICT